MVDSIVVQKMHNVINAEDMTSKCFKYIAELIKNGRIKGKFLSLSRVAQTNRDSLKRVLEQSYIHNFSVEGKCEFCKLRPENFSLNGAVDFALEVTDYAVTYYKRLIKMCEDSALKKILQGMLKEKLEQRNLLKEERSFELKRAAQKDLLSCYCLPQIVSLLWK